MPEIDLTNTSYEEACSALEEMGVDGYVCDDITESVEICDIHGDLIE